jgi:hypothetical protein
MIAMGKNQNGFHVVGLAIVIVVLGIIGLVGWRVMSISKATQTNSQSSSQTSGIAALQEGTGPNYKALAACGSQPPLNTVPINTSAFYQIVPLGNLNVPDHAIPTDHVYFAYNQPGDTTPLRAPGKIVVTSITYSGETKDGITHNDYAVNFFACKGVVFDFAHIGQLNGALGQAVNGDNWDAPCQKHSPAAGEETSYCTKTADIVLQAGDIIGIAGGPGKGAFDFGAHDASYQTKDLVTPSLYTGAYPNSVCALDYFDSASKAQLYTLLKRTQAPLCGQVGNDKANTAQGAWFATKDSQQAMSDWNTQLGLVPNNLNPDMVSLAVAGTVGQPSLFQFKPVHSGTINRIPSEVTASATVYCFQNEMQPKNSFLTSQGSGKFLMQLIDNKTLKVEHKDGSCSASEAFISPTTYYR